MISKLIDGTQVIQSLVLLPPAQKVLWESHSTLPEFQAS